MNIKTVIKTSVFVALTLSIIFLIYASCRSPESVKLAKKQTDDVIERLEQKVKQIDKTAQKIADNAKKEVTGRNVEIRNQVENLSPDAVAAELLSLLDEYRRECGD